MSTIDKSVGTLLYHIATKLKTQVRHREPLLVEYVTSKKISSEVQLNGEICIDIFPKKN